ncbi:Oidioi.mRNA.OKI2018_I69.chr2.g5802.t1.cds [Oikopleura dioica]|uniref:Oidioi.mRNA.OKI2018_I69.chr2.g5802.t1.cds n=1 Tax=Oikopleura dioica TaxID=34765 RepID=A0ABN7T809_OIKDI|nr:Oidioi.mRNA.OKI2018_I69.chr2.g5802.t1.cds [Oikopleura dioica]
MEQFFHSLLQTNPLSSLTLRIVRDRYKAEFNKDQDLSPPQFKTLRCVVDEIAKAEMNRKFSSMGIDGIKLEEARKIIEEEIDSMTRKLDGKDDQTRNRLELCRKLNDSFRLLESKLEKNDVEEKQQIAQFLIEAAEKLKGIRERRARTDRKKALIEEELARAEIEEAELKRLETKTKRHYYEIFCIKTFECDQDEVAADQEEEIERHFAAVIRASEETNKILNDFESRSKMWE